MWQHAWLVPWACHLNSGPHAYTASSLQTPRYPPPRKGFKADCNMILVCSILQSSLGAGMKNGNSKSNAAGQLWEGHMGAKKNRHLLRAHSSWVGEGILWNKYGQVTLLLSLLLPTVFWVTSFSSPAMKFGNLKYTAYLCIMTRMAWLYFIYKNTKIFTFPKNPKGWGTISPPSRTRTSNRWELYLFGGHQTQTKSSMAMYKRNGWINRCYCPWENWFKMLGRINQHEVNEETMWAVPK